MCCWWGQKHDNGGTRGSFREHGCRWSRSTTMTECNRHACSRNHRYVFCLMRQIRSQAHHFGTGPEQGCCGFDTLMQVHVHFEHRVSRWSICQVICTRGIEHRSDHLARTTQVAQKSTRTGTGLSTLLGQSWWVYIEVITGHWDSIF